jgi:hypothetical protein
MASNSRFKHVSDQDLDDLLHGNDSKSTQSTIKRAVSTFRKFLEENGYDPQFENLETPDLNERLRLFFASIRKNTKNENDGSSTMYKKNAFVSLRYGLSKHIKKEMGLDIASDTEFVTSQAIFQAMCTKIKKAGLGSTEHYPPISEEDLKRLYINDHHAFDINTPVGLQQKVWFEIVFYLCRRGRENIREMNKDTFKIGKDASGQEYVVQAIDEADKNHGSKDKPNDTIGEGRIYSIPGNMACPVLSFRKYLSKLNDECPDLWQRPLDSFIDEDRWYCNAPIGKNPLGGFMKRISAAAKLSMMYTNHSVRATHISTLDDAGYEARHIMRMSGHKSEASIRSYSHRLSDRKKRCIANTLAASVGVAIPESGPSNDPQPLLQPQHVRPLAPPQPQPVRPLAPQNVLQPVGPLAPQNVLQPVGPLVQQLAPPNLPDNSWQNVLDVSDFELLNAAVAVSTSNSLGMNFENRNAINFCPTLNNCNVTFNFSGGPGPSFGPRF